MGGFFFDGVSDPASTLLGLEESCCRSLEWQMPDLINATLANPINRAILQRLPMLGINEAWLVAGSVYQSFWNAQSGRPPTAGIKDYDLFYFDPTDLSYEAEDRVIERAKLVFADLDAIIDIKNQARVHLWYKQRFGAEYAPVSSAREAIGRFQIRCTCVGVRPRPDGTLDLHAPYGAEELKQGLLVVNEVCSDKSGALAKAQTYVARWPWLTIASVDQSKGN